MRRATKLVLFACVAWLAACSGGGAESGGSSEPAAGQAGQGGQGGGQPSAEAKLRAAQESAVQAMCERLIECSVESARASMTPEELAKLDLEEIVPRARADCEEEYAERRLSPRQVRVVQGCVNQPGTCDELHACLDQARKR
jgi:hypothetical protein